MSFYKNEGQGDKTVPIWGLIPVRRGRHKERVKEDEYGGNTMY
jgi:hypothetical protein